MRGMTRFVEGPECPQAFETIGHSARHRKVKLKIQRFLDHLGAHYMEIDTSTSQVELIQVLPMLVINSYFLPFLILRFKEPFACVTSS